MLEFNSIPLSLRVPGSYIEFDNSMANTPLPAQLHRVLLFGQRKTAGTVAAGVATRIYASDDSATLFGRGSMLDRMIQIARSVSTNTELWAIAQDDLQAGTAATGSVSFAGPATVAGTLPFYIAGTQVETGVTAGMTAAQLATAFAAAVNAQPDLPVTAAVDATTTSKVNLTCVWKGLTGNDIDLRSLYYRGDVIPTGITPTIVAMAGGAGNPSLTASIAGLGDVWFHSWAVPYTDGASIAAVQAELNRRNSPTVQLRGRSYSFVRDTVGNLGTLGSSYNNQFLTFLGMAKLPSPTWEATASLTMTVGTFAPIDPARPLGTLPLPGVLAPVIGDRFVQDDRESLLHQGISTAIVDDGGNVLIERLITTYQTTPAGLPDTSYLDVETVLTLFYLDFWLRQRIATKWPRFKLAPDGNKLPVGQAITSPRLIKLDLIAGANTLVDAGLITSLDDFKASIITEISASDPDRVNCLFPPTLVNRFLVFGAQIQFRL
ncbi:MAG TPA: phage tail sheath subtilisin-like domain-containing protein [Aliidongia sp.]|uniref:phage tail sheath subtilisin-like domain-containing protein n=1 Tax=Aliidongia sp. TaxID=1914230 RepID=UPI002DDD568B|nr:phage tail sheath subtilisin-like domain-containing protein [Aliidongia sp.]HEV2675276.1 phage tail sheath subtilisin-like domain-containing protein [Aliidongia sp.]